MFNEQMRKLGQERSAIRELFEYGKARKREVGEENVFDFSIGNPSAPPPPAVAEEIGRILRECAPLDVHGYTSAQGLLETRQAVADHLRSLGAPADPSLVYMTCGASASLTVFFCALLNEGDEVIVPAPYFPEYAVFISRAKGKLVPVKMTADFHLDIGEIGAAITEKTRAVLINSPNNPTGAVYSDGELKALADLLKEKSETRPIWLVSDEPYRELCYVAPPAEPMRLYPETATLYSFSKALSLAGERIGYIALSKEGKGAAELYEAVCGAGRSLGYVCAPALFQRLIAGCIGQTADLSVYRKNRQTLSDELKKYGFSFASPEGAFYFFLKSPEEDAAAFCERAKRHEILIVPSDSFGVKGYARLSYCVSPQVIGRSFPAFRALAKEYGLI